MKALLPICVLFLVLFLTQTQSLASDGNCKQKKEKRLFEKLNGLSWKHVFYDSCSLKWQDKWLLDGKKASITNSFEGMDFFSGPVRKENASHSVLWTKESFKGDLKIEYEYTKLDEVIEAVTILYIQATGSETEGYNKDIMKWSEKREIPKMSEYFNHMKMYHISYAAFKVGNTKPQKDYIKARRYKPETNKGLEGTEFGNVYLETGLFKTGVAHRITIIKKGNHLFMHISNKEKELLCYWETGTQPPIEEGRIGLRHMWTRGARYKNFRISTL